MQMILVLGAAVLLAAFSGDSGNPLDRALAAADQSIAHNNRGVAYARLGWYDAALSDFTAAKSMAAGDSILFTNMKTAKKLLYARKHDLAPPPAVFQVRDQSRAMWLF
jgi:hypothetical protein